MIIPSMDVLNGSVVKLRGGDPNAIIAEINSCEEIISRVVSYSKKFTTLHVVDLGGALQTHANRDLVGMICSVAHKNGMKTQVGGGIRSLDAIRETLSFSEKVVVGSLAVHDPQVVVEGCNLYPGRVVVALDCRGDCVSVKGWASDTMMLPEDAYEPFRGIADVLMTQVHVEGSGAGPDFELYRRFLSAYPDCAVQASGGIRNDSDVNMLYRLGVSHVILGRALYEGALHCEV